MELTSEVQKNVKETAVYRRFLVVAGSLYFMWWLVVEALLPEAFNPFASRLAVVLTTFACLGLTYVLDWCREHIRLLFAFCVWLITSHYYYLFYANAQDVNWIVGSYITVTAISLSMLSRAAILSYSAFVLFLSIGLTVLVPELKSSVFLPGLVTIVIQANVGLRARLHTIRILRDSNERFRLLFNSTFEGLLVQDGRKIVDANESLARMLNYQRDDLVGKDILEILHPSAHSIVEDSMASDDVSAFETCGLNRQGQSIDIEVRAKSFTYRKRKVRLVTIQEISDRKKAHQEQVKALAMSENVRVRDEFISIASHELKTPITSLKLQTDLIERELKKNQGESYPRGKVIDFVALYHRQISRLTELVESMLDVSRISAGKPHLKADYFDLSLLVREIAESRHILDSHGGALLNLDAPERLIIWGDARRIEQVVENLLNNAVKYGRNKPIDVTLRKEGNIAILQIRDNGIGIPQEAQERIFQRFERAISQRHIGGLGLGLYISKQLVEAHHGVISVQSTLGEGSTFTVRIPIPEHASSSD